MGNTDSHLLRNRPPSPRSWHLGIGRNCTFMGRACPRAQPLAANPGNDCASSAGHADRHSRRHTGRTRQRRKRPASRRHRRSRRATNCSDCRPALMANFSRGLYTFQSLRYRQAASCPAIGEASRRYRYRARRPRGRTLCAGCHTSSAALSATKLGLRYSVFSWDSPTAFSARKI